VKYLVRACGLLAVLILWQSEARAAIGSATPLDPVDAILSRPWRALRFALQRLVRGFRYVGGSIPSNRLQ
jgi:hypothetical protein